MLIKFVNEFPYENGDLYKMYDVPNGKSMVVDAKNNNEVIYIWLHDHDSTLVSWMRPTGLLYTENFTDDEGNIISDKLLDLIIHERLIEVI